MYFCLINSKKLVNENFLSDWENLSTKSIHKMRGILLKEK